MTIDVEQQISARVTRRFGASAERVFDAWLDPKTARKWLFAKAAGQIVCAEIDGRVGGWFYIVTRCDGEDVEHVGEYFEVNRPHRLGFKLLVADYAQSFDRVTVDIVPLAHGCELTLTNEPASNIADQVRRIEACWSDVLDRLAEAIGERSTRATILEAPAAWQR
jgi:uncharacterized protein YndB with AHSA1/START domain